MSVGRMRRSRLYLTTQLCGVTAQQGPPAHLILLAALIGRLGRRGTGLVGVLGEVPAVFGHEFGPPAVQCESRAPSDLLEEDSLARPVVDVEELEMPISELRSEQLGDFVNALVSSPYAPTTRPKNLPEL